MSARIQKAVFVHEGDLLRATVAARASGYRIIDAYTPFAVHGLDRAMGLRPSRLTWVCFLCGLFGAAFMAWFQFWTSAVDWPINVGGKPWNSWPAFVPVVFEAAVLLGGLGVVFAMFARCGLVPGRGPKLPGAGVTDDRFILAVAGSDDSPSFERLAGLLRDHGAVEVIEDLEESLA